MTRRHFIQHAPKAAGAGIVAAIAVLKYQATDAKDDIKDHEARIRNLESYSTSMVTQIQMLLGKQKHEGDT